mmetsp:Transcript_29236/g.83569  ORF Transcript_29236/g.83569 Transcript_29236/m.83569 type:complete len:798 (-) Transcript_29236:583-2976(-)
MLEGGAKSTRRVGSSALAESRDLRTASPAPICQRTSNPDSATQRTTSPALGRCRRVTDANDPSAVAPPERIITSAEGEEVERNLEVALPEILHAPVAALLELWDVFRLEVLVLPGGAEDLAHEGLVPHDAREDVGVHLHNLRVLLYLQRRLHHGQDPLLARVADLLQLVVDRPRHHLEPAAAHVAQPHGGGVQRPGHRLHQPRLLGEPLHPGHQLRLLPWQAVQDAKLGLHDRAGDLLKLAVGAARHRQARLDHLCGRGPEVFVQHRRVLRLVGLALVVRQAARHGADARLHGVAHGPAVALVLRLLAFLQAIAAPGGEADGLLVGRQVLGHRQLLLLELHLPDLREFAARIVLEEEGERDAGFEAGVALEELLHLVGVASADDDHRLALVLHLLDQRVDGLLAEAVLVPLHERVRLVDEQHASERLLHHRLHLGRRLALEARHQVGAGGLAEDEGGVLLVFGRRDGAHGHHELADDARDDGLASPGVPEEAHVRALACEALQAELLTLLTKRHLVQHRGHGLLELIQADKRIQLRAQLVGPVLARAVELDDAAGLGQRADQQLVSVSVLPSLVVVQLEALLLPVGVVHSAEVVGAFVHDGAGHVVFRELPEPVRADVHDKPGPLLRATLCGLRRIAHAHLLHEGQGAAVPVAAAVAYALLEVEVAERREDLRHDQSRLLDLLVQVLLGRVLHDEPLLHDALALAHLAQRSGHPIRAGDDHPPVLLVAVCPDLWAELGVEAAVALQQRAGRAALGHLVVRLVGGGEDAEEHVQHHPQHHAGALAGVDGGLREALGDR